MNDCLEIGPNYTPHVFDTLVKFRWNSIGVTADIEKAFLMIGIKSSDRDALRFLWFDDPNECHPELTVYRFKRLVFGLRPSPAILGFTISHHLDRYFQSDSKLVSLLKESFYVDDLVTGEESVEQSFHIYKRSKEIMEDGGSYASGTPIHKHFVTKSKYMKFRMRQLPTANQLKNMLVIQLFPLILPKKTNRTRN